MVYVVLYCFVCELVHANVQCANKLIVTMVTYSANSLKDLLKDKRKIWLSSIVSALNWHLITSELIMTSVLEENEEEYTSEMVFGCHGKSNMNWVLQNMFSVVALQDF